jgi:hypothetical protein
MITNVAVKILMADENPKVGAMARALAFAIEGQKPVSGTNNEFLDANGFYDHLILAPWAWRNRREGHTAKPAVKIPVSPEGKPFLLRGRRAKLTKYNSVILSKQERAERSGY